MKEIKQQAFNAWGRLHSFDPRNPNQAVREVEQQLLMAEKFQEAMIHQPVASLMEDSGEYTLHRLGGAAILEALETGVAGFDTLWVMDPAFHAEREDLAWAFAIGTVREAYDRIGTRYWAELFPGIAQGLNNAWNRTGLPTRSSVYTDRSDAIEWLMEMAADDRVDAGLEGLEFGIPEATRHMVEEDRVHTQRLRAMNRRTATRPDARVH